MMDENEFFREATLRIMGSLNVEIAMRRCQEYLARFMPVSGIFFGLYEPEVNIARMLATVWPEGMPSPERDIALPKAYWKWMKERWSSAPKLRVFNDADEEDEPYREIVSRIWPSPTSQIHMTLELENQRLGVLGIFAEGKNRYSDQHARLLSLLHEPFAAAMSNILQHQEILRLKDLLADDNRYLNQELVKITGDLIVGENFGLAETMKIVRQVAPLDSPVLLMGETGVGKEVIANALHHASARARGPLIKVNCGAIPDNLMDSELFGHEKGAFTGALSRKRGRFERAHGGTIFLDEVGELTPPAQVRLLRVVQNQEIERVGGTETIRLNVRIISATHRNLEEDVRSGRFREDLWFRLNVFPIIIPPLRRRTEDIPALVAFFVERKAQELKMREVPPLAPGALDPLLEYAWPGNVRELENLVERALILHQLSGKGGLLRLGRPGDTAGPPERKQGAGAPGTLLTLDQVISRHIREALARSGGKIEGENGAARLLGLHPSTLRGKMRKLGIHYGRKAPQGGL